jgi:predicted amidophosphoribosyltransferase
MPAMLLELLGLVVPPRCALCGRECRLRAQLCSGCETDLGGLVPSSTPVPGLDAAWSAAPYDGVARDLVVALKFTARLPLARQAGAVIAERAPADLLEGVIVPVPAAPVRRRHRGFDTAEAIAAALGVETGLPLHRCLRRSQGRRQVGRPRSERLAYPPRVRLAATPPPVAVVVDDVVTTGATIRSCARALRSGGCGRVVALTFARSSEGAPTAPSA